jgi:putative spermidine/putrescine transport system permease protein
MSGERAARIALRMATIAVLGFIYAPIVLVFVYSLNAGTTTVWPPVGLSFRWYLEAFQNTGLQQAFLTSIGAGIGATVIALILGTLASLAVSRHHFFGREAVSFAVIFPIALPGIITGIALSATFAQLDIPLGYPTIVIGHATFCIVLVYNNAIARLRRTARTYEEASADLGADSFQTFRHVTFPAVRTSLVAGALLAFALSFDEVIVTIFTSGGVKTLPIWIFQSFRLANQVPVVNVAGVVAILLSAIPVYIASRVAGGDLVAGPARTTAVR